MSTEENKQSLVKAVLVQRERERVEQKYVRFRPIKNVNKSIFIQV